MRRKVVVPSEANVSRRRREKRSDNKNLGRAATQAEKYERQKLG